jgi:hypothetical protein
MKVSTSPLTPAFQRGKHLGFAYDGYEEELFMRSYEPNVAGQKEVHKNDE